MMPAGLSYFYLCEPKNWKCGDYGTEKPSWWAQASGFHPTHTWYYVWEEEFISCGTVLCVHRYFAARFWVAIRKYFVDLPGQTFDSQGITQFLFLSSRNPLIIWLVSSSLMAPRLWVPQVPGFFFWTCLSFLLLQRKTRNFWIPWKPAVGYGGEIFGSLQVSEQTQQDSSLPHAELSLIIFRDLELTEEGLYFSQWYFSTSTKNSGDKRD